MAFDVIATVPSIFDGFKTASILGRAAEKGLLSIRVHDLRSFSDDKHHTIDDSPFGGGAGMVLKPAPLFAAIEAIRKSARSRLILLTPQGVRFTQKYAADLAGWSSTSASGASERQAESVADDQEPQIVIVCGRYEGVDERVIEHFKPELVSIGDYVIAGGEVAAMVVIEAVSRLLKGVLGNEESISEESFSGTGSSNTGLPVRQTCGENLLEYPHYTRPAEFRGYKVPDVLLSGHHKGITEWRSEQRQQRTRLSRPDLLDSPPASGPEGNKE